MNSTWAYFERDNDDQQKTVNVYFIIDSVRKTLHMPSHLGDYIIGVTVVLYVVTGHSNTYITTFIDVKNVVQWLCES